MLIVQENIARGFNEALTLPVGRDGKILLALRTNRVASLVTVPS